MDIEVLVDYIEKKGFEVRVDIGLIKISKEMEGEIYEFLWGISKAELQHTHECILFHMADYYMGQLDPLLKERTIVESTATVIEDRLALPAPGEK